MKVKYDVYEFADWSTVPEKVQEQPKVAPMVPYLKKMGTFDADPKAPFDDIMKAVGAPSDVVNHDSIGDDEANINIISLWREPAYLYAPAGTDLKKH